MRVRKQGCRGVKRALVLDDDDGDGDGGDDACPADDESDDRALLASSIAEDSAMCADEPLTKRQRGLQPLPTNTHMVMMTMMMKLPFAHAHALLTNSFLCRSL